MRTIPLWLALVGCGGGVTTETPPAPYVTAMTPTSGPWGSVVTIMGANFGEVPSPSNVVAFTSSIGAAGFVVETWHDTKIEGQIAFPATGALTVQGRGGMADAGEFTTTVTYVPSTPIDVGGFINGLVLPSGDVAGLYHQYELTNAATLAVFSGASAGAYTLDNVANPSDKTATIFGKVVQADDGSAAVIATREDATVALFTIANRQVVATDTGLNGGVMAAGRDATGLYVWVVGGTGLLRARPAMPTWTTDLGPFAVGGNVLDGAVASDGTVWLAESEPGAAQMAYLSTQMLAPAGTQLTALTHADDTAYANEISRAQIEIASDGMQAVITATADAQGTPVDFARARSAAGTWAAAPSVTGCVQYAFTGTMLGAITNDPMTKSTALVHDATNPGTAEVIPVWPMQSSGVIVDAAGKSHPLLSNGNVTYALAPPN